MADLLKNFAYCKLAANVAAADTTFPVDTVSRLPSSAQLAAADFFMTVDSPLATGAFEIVKVAGLTTTSVEGATQYSQTGAATTYTGGLSYFATDFTPSVTATVQRIRLTWNSTQAAGTVKVGIASSITGGSVTYLSSGTITKPVVGENIIDMVLPVTLTAGTTYYLAAEDQSGTSAIDLGIRQNTAGWVTTGATFGGNVNVTSGGAAGSYSGYVPVVKLVSLNTTSTLTVARAQEGTAAVAHNSGDYLKSGLTAGIWGRLGAYKGTWGAASGYNPGDTVSDAYGLYAALRAVPTGLGSPSTSPAIPGAVTAAGGTMATGSSSSMFNATSIAQAFTTPAAGSSVDTITMSFAAAPAGANNFKIGIASSLGATPGAIVWVNTPATVSRTGLGQAIMTITLPAVAVLAASTTYYLALQGQDNGSSGADSVTYVTTGPTVTTGAAVASVSSTVTHSGSSSALNTVAWNSLGGYTLLWTLGKAAPSTPYWSKIANVGNDPMAIDSTASHFKGAWGSTAAYSANDQVSESYALYAALTAVPGGQGAPSTGPTYLPASASLGGTTASGTSVGSSASIAQAFTTPTSGSPTVSSISFSVNNTSTGLPGGTFKVGIASALGASPSAVTWVGAPSAVVSVAAGAPLQTLTATLATPATLAPSTQYWVVFQTADAAGAGASVVTAVNSGATVSAGAAVASLGASAYEPSWSSASTVAWYTTSGTQTLAWSLYGGSLPYWQKLATISPVYLQGIVAGAQTVKTNALPPGLYVPQTCTISELFFKVGTAPVGAALGFDLVQKRGATTIATLSMSIGAGTDNATYNSSGYQLALQKNDFLQINVTQIGSTTAGSDLLIAVKAA